MLAVLHGRFRIEAETEQIAFSNAHLSQESIGRRVTTRDGEIPGRRFFDVDIKDNAIRCRAWFRHDLDFLEIGQIPQPPFRTADQGAVVWIAFADVEFATNDVVTRANIA